METTMFVQLHEAPKRPKLNLESVKALIEYLHGLPQEMGDRDLSMLEDGNACMILWEIMHTHDTPSLRHMIEYYTDPRYKISRTMCVWYGIARNIADVIQHEEYCE